ncbi:MAG: LysR family transcriptional regulator [Gammaproteobacteria bacterium]|nr:LysR family transcriptional regulator [Gammaproteobacteria bacterium]MBQ0838369.1 LysR family transcriptional regulator [Gammaproteobacteria bacterium]
MIEHSHLRIIAALHKNGTLTAAANTLCLSQSALSHQIRSLEKKLGVALWERDGRYLRLTHAGQLLLQVAEQVLPVLAQAEQSLKAYGEGRQGILRIGVECYPCYEWLTGVTGEFMRQMPDVDIDIVSKFQFSGLEGLLNHHIDILITPDLIKQQGSYYEVLADYELVLVLAEAHPLAQLQHISPEQLAGETLLTFPVPIQRLDIFNHFLSPLHLKPARHKVVESLDLMLQMTELQRGVCVLPRWLAEIRCKGGKLSTLQLGDSGMQRKLYIAMRESDRDVAYIRRFIEVGRATARQSFQAND